MRAQRRFDRGREAMPIHRQRATGRQSVLVGRAQDERARAPHFFVQQSHGIVESVVGPEGIGADQFGQALGHMGLRPPQRAHLMQDDRQTLRCDLPPRLAAGEAAADDVDGYGVLRLHVQEILASFAPGAPMETVMKTETELRIALERSELPTRATSDWLASEPKIGGDYADDALAHMRFWRAGEELLAQ